MEKGFAIFRCYSFLFFFFSSLHGRREALAVRYALHKGATAFLYDFVKRLTPLAPTKLKEYY